MAEHLYLVFPEPHSSNSPTSNLLMQEKANATDLVPNIQRVFWLLDVEDFMCFYDLNNIQQYFQFFENEEGEHYTYPNTVRYFLFKNERFTRWNITTHLSQCDKITIFEVPQTTRNTFCEVAKRTIDGTDVPMAIVKYDVEGLKADNIPTTVNGNSISLNILKLSFDDISEWLATHRVPERVYRWNRKHGEYGRGAHSEQKNRGEVSVLMSGRDDPKYLIPKAIGHLEVKEGEPHNNLYIYDEPYQMFLCFMYDSGSQTFHAFHTTWNKLPEEIKKKYRIINPNVEE